MKVPRIRAFEWPLLFAVFLDLVGFGMAFPDIQLRAEDYGAPGWMIGLLLSSYFVVQLIASPMWGRESDRTGRKRILLICTALSAISMVVYALVPSILGILASRVLAGLAAANVVVGQAFIADQSNEEELAGAMGRVNSALLLGLVAGPAIGGFLADRFGAFGMGMTAAAASTLSFVCLALFIPNIPPKSERRPGEKRFVFDLSLLKSLPHLKRLFVVAAAGWFVLACLEGTFGRLIRENLNFGRFESGLIFSYESLLGAGISAGLVYLTARLTSGAILRWGYVLQGFGIALMPLAPNLGLLFAASTLYALGLGCVNPTINAVCSEATPGDRQGELFGLIQATRSIGFIAGPTIGGLLFDLRPALPYFVAAGVACIAAILIQTPPKTNPKSSEIPA